jgi:uncharacterized membrane protein
MTSPVDDDPALSVDLADLSDDESADRKLGIALVVTAAFGAFASAMLLIDRFAQLEAQAKGDVAALLCNVNAIVNCGSVLQSREAEVFGFPSPVLGLPAFAAIATFGLTLLTRYRPPRWVWLGLQVGVSLGIIFVTWLQYVSIFVLTELCPWCIVVWVSMIPMFVLVTARVTRWRLLRNWTTLIVALWYLLVASGIVVNVVL